MKYNNIELYANKPAPLLNTNDFKSVFCDNMPLDKDHLLRALELVALPGTALQMKGQRGNICEVELAGYPVKRLFVDKRFVSEKSEHPKAQMPKKEVILKRMQRMCGKPYIWGGNYCAGVPEMLIYYPPTKPISGMQRSIWTFAGVDCSGLLYEACHGLVPRNTSQLIGYGEERELEDLEPLDLLVWKGHIVVALDRKRVIESRLGQGVVVTPIEKRLKEIESDLAVGRIDQLFVRRFY